MHVGIVFTMLSEASVPFIFGLIYKPKWYNTQLAINQYTLWAIAIKATRSITVAVAVTFLRITAIAIRWAYPSALKAVIPAPPAALEFFHFTAR
jgi:hypothetical protein